MTIFVIASAALVLLVLAWVLRPLWRTRRAIGLAAIAVLTLATGLTYTLVGTPSALDPAQRSLPRTMDEAIALLEAELERDPNQVEGLRMLAAAYASQDRTADARDALARAVALAPDDPDLLAQAAEARAIAAEGRRFDDEAITMLRRALAQQPMHQHARWFLGIAQRQRGKAAEAAATWEPLLTMVDSPTGAGIREQINAARSEAGLPPLPAPAAEPQADAGINVSISLDPALAMRLPDDATLFVIARQPGGPPMPVAVQKVPVVQFPLVVTLTDADGPMPTLKLSQLDRIELIARISASGDARPQPGDFEAAPVVVDRSAGAAALLIDRVVQ
ncbi:MAG: tetratricopeptide repeat protein [Lysobacter sp.]|nr:tetratricopeptide repeat protein [Lysobacter sp.]MDQ3269642.1 tetratricopeptide repeat protein [Pseudomonadota bacterium]